MQFVQLILVTISVFIVFFCVHNYRMKPVTLAPVVPQRYVGFYMVLVIKPATEATWTGLCVFRQQLRYIMMQHLFIAPHCILDGCRIYSDV